MEHRTFAKKMEEHRLLIFNGSTPEILPFLEPMGIDIPHLDAGKALYNEVMDLVKNQTTSYQEKGLAYDDSKDSLTNCDHVYKRTRRLVKMASRADKNLQDRIKIKAIRARTIEDWIAQVIEFYDLVLNETEFLGKITKYGLTVEKLSAQKEEVAAIQTLRNNATSNKGQAMDATMQRDKKIEDLDDYCYELKTVAIVALEDHPKLLEILGIRIKA